MFRKVLITLGFVFFLFSNCYAEELSAMIGQMIMVGIKDTSPEGLSLVKKQIEQGKIGGVILYKYNIESPEQVKKFNKELKIAAGKKRPVLFTAVDQEGGKVQRLVAEKGFRSYPSQKETAAKLSPEKAYRQYLNMANDIAEAGFNVNFAPSADLDVNPDSPVIGKLGRSFSGKVDQVVLYAEEFVKAHNRAGVITSIKHFPGHGSALADSHLGFTDVTNTWSRKELEPFRILINKGLAPSIMTAHVFNSTVDSAYPATLSKKHIDILRKELEYGGVVFTDDLQMGAVRDNYPLEEAVVNAVNAGADVLVYSNFFFNDPEFPEKAADIIKKAGADGRISLPSIEHSYERIITLKRNLR